MAGKWQLGEWQPQTGDVGFNDIIVQTRVECDGSCHAQLATDHVALLAAAREVVDADNELREVVSFEHDMAARSRRAAAIRALAALDKGGK